MNEYSGALFPNSKFKFGYWVRSGKKVQSDSDDSSSAVGMNSATEISTDSEFERDPVIRDAPKILIDDSHLKKPTRVQVKQGTIGNGVRKSPPVKPNPLQHAKTDIHLEFKPLVQVDPSVLSSNRTPLQNPRIGDYNLKQTASTEGIASKKSLELKKRYLLGETATSGIMKSDSTSVLDSKFKNFRSTISDCQKLLNPASEISPAMKHFLKNTNISDNKSSSQTENTTSRESVKEVKEELHKNGEEKENVYDRIVSTKNELNKSDIELSKPARISDYAETINIVLVENKIKELSAKPIDTIDLTTPEKADASEPTIDVTKIELSQKVIATNQAFINSLDTSPIKNNVVIDLTGDSPQKDISITVKVENPDPNPKYQEDEKSPKTKAGMSPERTKHAIDSMLQKRGSEQSRSPIHETSITVPKIPWVPKNNEDDDVESDSLSSNSSSSVDDIPHYILDSTTSPDTQPGDRFVPRLEIRDTSGELMQIDSLMIIDGKYVGDPEDLKHMKMPERMAPPKPEAPPVPPKAATNVSVTNIEPVGTKKTEQIRAAGISTPKIEVNNSAKAESTSSTESPEKRKPTIYRYESFNRRPDLKFDTKNENKIDTLKNLPLILPKELENVAKPTDLPIGEAKKASDASDNDKTPTVAHPCIAKAADPVASDSETEITGQALTETELSDWTADDAVSENFVDIEFALNSNKGTIKRNKKSKRKHSSSSSVQKKQNGPKTECPIVKDLDFDNIEFMDTGSEDSCVETYSATNKAMLKNRGYVQFVNTTNPQNKDVYKYKNTFGSMVEKPQKPSSIDISDNTTRNVEIPGVDYIEQGACILSNEIDLKTPMNEMPPIFAPVKQLEQHDSLNDVEDDSLVMVASHGGHTTTEESDALTVVTSPMESMPRNIGSSSVNTSFDKTGSSSTNKSSPSKKSLSKDAMTPTNESPIKRKSSQEDILNISGRKESDDMSYEEYVRQLQLKITQISNARDSIDVRKTKRKHSRADGSFDGPMPPTTVIDNNKPLSIYVNKTLPEAPVTETARIEELTKERTKQKDLIHDLVMNKLQSKKQLNAEKRLNRSRNRSSILSPPNNATATGPPSTSSSAISLPHNPSSCSIGQRSMQSGGDLFNSLKMLESERRASLYNSTKALSSKPNEPYFATPAKHLQASAAKERPRSDNIEAYPVFETPKLNKTQSFCVYANRNAAPARMRFNASPMQAQFADNVSGFSTPMATNRRTNDESVTQTEKLRQEARARARAKSNQDLGLSPEEKIALLRKRYHLDMSNASQASSMAPSTTGSSSGADLGGVINKSDDMKVRERKMMASKSVNDIAASHRTGDSGSRPKSAQKLTDSSSDPNLLDGKTPSKRRHKDPERRKSIIQTVSDFFHKKKEKEPSSPKEKSEGMFGRFRISPKSKSKDKEEISYERSKSEDCLKIKQNSSYSSGCQSEELTPPPIPPLPTNYQRSDDESYSANESRDHKKIRAITKASRQAELKRLRIAQEIQREQEEIEVKLKDLEARGVQIEKALRGEGQNLEEMDPNTSVGANDEKLLKELLEIWRNITHLKKRDEELGIRQKELQLEHRHAQLKEELNVRLSCSRLDKSSSDVAAEGAILNEMLEIVAKRAALRPSDAGLAAECTSADGLNSDIL